MKNNEIEIATVQTAARRNRFSGFSSYYSAAEGHNLLFQKLREAVPVVDAALGKLVRLVGEFEIKTGDENLDKKAKRFLESVPVGAARFGANAFFETFLNELLTFGTAVGEIVLDGGKIVNLFNSNQKNVALSLGENPLELVVSSRDKNGAFKPVKNPNLILVSMLNPEPGSVYGKSILEGLPYVSDLLLRIFDAIGANWDRIGNVRYCVTYKPQNDTTDKAFAKSRARMIADEWSKTINSFGPVKDFIAVGDVEIKAIGADNRILDSEIPVRQLLEQIVSKLGVPPFLLGLSWSSTERMSSRQADILTSEIEAYRRNLNPIIRRIMKLFFALRDERTDFEIEWNDITLRDITELAQSELLKAQTEQIINERNNQ